MENFKFTLLVIVINVMYYSAVVLTKIQKLFTKKVKP